MTRPRPSPAAYSHGVDPDGVADDVVRTFQRLHFSAIAQRAGRHRGGYVHETDAGWELLEETL